MSEVIKAGVSFFGLGAVANGFMQWTTPFLTFIGLLLAACWYSAELYESKFIQDLLAKWRKPPAPPQAPSATAP